jgi:hypothetical protein
VLISICVNPIKGAAKSIIKSIVFIVAYLHYKETLPVVLFFVDLHVLVYIIDNGQNNSLKGVIEDI